MPARVKVRAVIWVGERVVVSRSERRGQLHVSLPGGRVNERESVTDALRREVLEEVGLEVDPGELLFAAEVLSGTRLQDVELIFEARPIGEVDQDAVDLVDPRAPGVVVRPPVLGRLSGRRLGEAGAVWLGNLYSADRTLPES